MPMVLKSIVGNIACPSSLNTPANSLLVTLDVPSSLHSNIPQNEDINGCEHLLCTSSHNTIPTGTLCDHSHMILTMNNFSSNDNHYLQIHGTAMGIKMAPSFANHFLGYFDVNTLENAPFQPHTWTDGQTDRQPLF